MKAFTQYLYETHKTFEFCIKLANHEPTSENLDRIKHALETYSLATISKPKRLPIQEHREFPNLGACECHLIDFAVNYPVTTAQLAQVLSERAFVPPGSFMVRTKNEYDQTEAAEAYGKDHEGALLEQPELKAAPGGQEVVGQQRIGSLIKELESRKYEIAGKEKSDGKTLNDIPTEHVSPVGSRQNKIPSPVKGK